MTPAGLDTSGVAVTGLALPRLLIAAVRTGPQGLCGQT
jgi:hypothetical protein